MNPIEQYILTQQDPYQSIMLYVRSVILKNFPEIKEKYSFKIPFFNYKNKPLLYLNILKGTNYVDVAFVQGILFEEKYPMLKDNNNRKQVRSLQLKTLEDLDEKMFLNLLKDAMASLDRSKRAWFI